MDYKQIGLITLVGTVFYLIVSFVFSGNFDLVSAFVFAVVFAFTFGLIASKRKK